MAPTTVVERIVAVEEEVAMVEGVVVAHLVLKAALVIFLGLGIIDSLACLLPTSTWLASDSTIFGPLASSPMD